MFREILTVRQRGWLPGARRGCAALEVIERTPDVAVVDVVMPDIDGIEVVQWLAAKAAELHLVIVTGFTPNYATLAKTLGEAKGLRSVVTLTKPVRMAALRKALGAAG